MEGALGLEERLFNLYIGIELPPPQVAFLCRHPRSESGKFMRTKLLIPCRNIGTQKNNPPVSVMGTGGFAYYFKNHS